jgi:diguanylate cyclase (GGDEF)-like protein
MNLASTPLNLPHSDGDVVSRVHWQLDQIVEHLTTNHCRNNAAQTPQHDANANICVLNQLQELRTEISDFARELSNSRERAEELARAQADALVNSAEIIDELEQTKLALSAAQAAAERRASDNQQLADTIFAKTRDAVLIFNRENCVSANSNSYTVLEQDSAEILGCWPSRLTANWMVGGLAAHSELTHRFASALQGKAGEMQIGIRSLSQGVRWCEVKLSGFVMNDQPFVLMTISDISQERKQQERLRLLAGVFNNVGEGVAIINTQGTIIEANPRFRSMFAYHHDMDWPISNLLNLSDFDLASELHRVCQGIPWSGKVCSTNPQGDSSWYWLSLSSYVDQGGSGNRIIALFSDITQIEHSKLQLERQALHDNLTGLPNRLYFRSYLDDLIREKATKHQSFSICFMDLDNFKTVNDTLGHGAGDDLLLAVSRRLRDTIGTQAFIARFGGDEFAAVLPQRREGDASTEASIGQLIESFADSFVVGSQEVSVGLTVGIARFPADGTDTDTLMCNADTAMYAAKAAGKNRMRSFNPEMQEKTDKRNFIFAELRKALQGGGLSLVFQPKVWNKTLKVAGCEALARWQRPDGTMISPAEFIPIAEQTGVIQQLGDYVMSLALETCREWHQLGLPLFPVAVNVSPQQLRTTRFLERLLDSVNEYGVQPEWIELEITEHAVMEDIQASISTINRLSEVGFRIAIDDFGTGYSSLNYLRHFPIHTLKIDRSFVNEVTTERNQAAIAKAIIALGQGLQLTTVAEGVETMEQFRFLAEAGCDITQGYLISKPISRDQMVEWAQLATNLPQKFSGLE